MNDLNWTAIYVIGIIFLAGGWLAGEFLDAIERRHKKKPRLKAEPRPLTVDELTKQLHAYETKARAVKREIEQRDAI